MCGSAGARDLAVRNRRRWFHRQSRCIRALTENACWNWPHERVEAAVHYLMERAPAIHAFTSAGHAGEALLTPASPSGSV